MHILFLFFKVKKKGCISCRFGFVLWRKCASRYTNSPFIYSDIYSHTHAFCQLIKYYVSHIVYHTKEFKVKSPSSRYLQSSEITATKWISRDENTNINATLRKRCVNMSHYCLSSPRDISKNSISISIHKRDKATSERTG